MLEDLMKKAKKHPIDPKEAQAKMGILKEIHDMASGHMGDEVKGMKKVEVMSPDKAGLQAGLSKASDLVKSAPGEGENMLGEAADEAEDNAAEHEEVGGEDGGEEDLDKPSAEHMIEEQVEHESDEGDLSSDEIDELEKFLEEQKAKKKK